MRPALALDEALLQRLPLPLAQLCRRAHNAQTPLERHLTAFYFWEAALKLLGSVAVMEYAEHREHDPELTERLQCLARPALGHWWEIVRRLLPELARGSEPFRHIQELLLGKARDDLPRAAGLDALLREVLDGKGGARSTVRLADLFDRLVRLRNAEVGHGAAGQREASFYERTGPALLGGLAELLDRLDVLAGRRLLHVADVRRLASGNWLVERYELAGETARRLESLEVPETEAERLPRPGRLYLHDPTAAGAPWRLLHPLVLYDAETARVFFLNSRRGRLRVEYLCYATGEVVQRDELGADRRELLARILGGPVEEAAAEAWAQRSQAEEPPVAEGPAPLRRLGEFELISRLGRGGMGVVYRAWQPLLGRQVALKCLLRPGDPKAEARFAREIRALGRVEHPHLVKVFLSGAEGDQWFYAMELVEGADLAAVCGRLTDSTASEVSENDWTRAVSTATEEQRRGEQLVSEGPSCEPAVSRTTVAEPVVRPGGWGHIARVVEVMEQAAEAAHALHEAGVVHRDIKPGNIMLSADGGHAVLMDLGLAQLADETEGRLTRTRQFVGTLRYASPEQLGGATLDRRTDVYSLGATLWELLALRPLHGITEQTPTPDMVLKLQQSEPERLRRHNPRVPADLEAIAGKCLEKDRNRRYATAAELAADLGRWRRGEPVLAQPPSLSYLLGKQLRRHRVPLAVAAGVLLAALVGVVIAFVQISRALARETQARSDAVEALDRAEQARRDRAQALVDALLKANPQAVPEVLRGLEAYPDDVLPRLRAIWAEDDGPQNRPRQLRAGLGLLGVDLAVKNRLAEWMLDVNDPAELLVVRDVLRPYGAELKRQLWAQWEDPRADAEAHFRIACVLAAYDPNDPRWEQKALEVATRLVAESPLVLSQWVEAFRPVSDQLLRPLVDVFRDGKRPEAERRLATALLAAYAADRADVLAGLLLDAADWQFTVLFPRLAVHGERAAERLLPVLAPVAGFTSTELDVGPAWAGAAIAGCWHSPGLLEAVTEALARRQARAAVALLRLERAEAVWPLFRHRPDPEVRSQLLARLATLGADARQLVRQLEAESEVSARRALILALGEFRPGQLPAEVREPLTAVLLRWYRDDPDPGIHGAIDWLLRHGKEGPVARPLDWGQGDALARIDAELALGRCRMEVGAFLAAGPQGPLHVLASLYVPPVEAEGRRWYVMGNGQTLAIVPQPEPFLMGSPGWEADHEEDETPHWQRIGRSFALATKPVTVRQYEEFLREHPEFRFPYTKPFSPERETPIISVSWYEAAAYCRWLSECEGVPEEQMCYPSFAKLAEAKREPAQARLHLPPDYLARTGYRLPTEAEWEAACRAGAVASRYHGSSEELLPRYAWYFGNLKNRTWPVGQKRPNDLGLFDVQGNVWQWCQESAQLHEPGTRDRPAEDEEDVRDITDSLSRVLRGGSFGAHAARVRSAHRSSIRPSDHDYTVGLRPARTYR